MNEILGITASAAEQMMEASSDFQPRREYPVTSYAGQTETRGLGSVSIKDQFKQAAETNNTNAMIHAMGLGFRSSKYRSIDAVQEDDRNDLLRSSGKSVAEYFAEKLRMKGVAKGAAALQDAKNPQDKKGKREST
jgi:hypothetical protein